MHKACSPPLLHIFRTDWTTPGYSVLGCFERLLGQAREDDGRRIHRIRIDMRGAYITEQIRYRHRQGNRPGNRSGVVRDWSSGNQESSRRTAAGAEPRGIICRRQTQPGGVHLHRDIDLYYLRGQLHAAAAEFRAADYRFRIPHLRNHRAVAHLRVPAGHGRDGAVDRVSDPALLHPPDRDLLDGSVHGRLANGLGRAELHLGAARARA